MEETLKDLTVNKSTNNTAYFHEEDRVKSFENIKHSCDPIKVSELNCN